MSKVIFKMTFKHPNLKDTVSKNASHINYIATRSGVDKTVTEADLKKELDKGIQNITSDDETYLKYIDERPRSHGLFGQEGIEDLKEVQDEISNVNSFVWRGIVSLKEDDAKRLGYLAKDQWQDMLRKKIPDMANEMGIPITNLRWAGAVHMEKGHPHAHIVLWEKEPKKTLGIISSKKLDNIRKVFTDEIFEEERMLLLQEKNAMRDLLTDLGKKDISQATKLIKEVRATGEEIRALIKDVNQEGIAPKLFNDDELRLAGEIENLIKMMPGKGRASLKFMPDDVKEAVGIIADEVLRQPEFTASLEKNLNAVEELTRLYTSGENAINHNKRNYSLVINKIAKNLKDNGLNNDEVKEILNEWTLDQDIQLDPKDTEVILNNVDRDDTEYRLGDDGELDINLISLKMLQTYKNIEVSDDDIIHNINRKLNNEFNDLLEKDLVRLNDDNTYNLSNDLSNTFDEFRGLDDYNRKILEVFYNNSFNSFEDILSNPKIKTLLFVKRSQSEFKLGKYDATIINSYFGDNNILNLDKLKGELAEKFKSKEKQRKEYEIITKRINRLISNDIVEKIGDNYSFTSEGIEKLKDVGKSFEFTSYDANVICKYIDESEGFLTEDKLLKQLKNEYNDHNEIKKQFKYLIKRLGNNVDSGYISKDELNGKTFYKLTDKGEEKREEINNPDTYNLKKSLKLLIEKGIIVEEDGKFYINEGLKYFSKNDLIDNIEGNSFSFSQIEEENRKYIDSILKNFENINTTYDDIKDTLNIKDMIDPITRARDNAYKDIRDRISQIILKGAVESQRDNIFYVDQELAQKAVDVIKGIKNQINLVPEHTRVFNQIAVALIRTNHTDENITERICKFAENENIEYSEEAIRNLIKVIRDEGAVEKEINPLSSNKKIDHYLSSLKLVGYGEKEAFDIILRTIERDSGELHERLQELKEQGILKVDGEIYKLTNKGIAEILSIKDLDNADKNILTILEPVAEEEEIKIASFGELLDDKEVFNSLYVKDPDEFKVGKFDLRIYEEFGEDNKLIIKDLEERIYSKYTDKESMVDTDIRKVDRAEKEFESISKRIEKLCINGYVVFDKESGVYSFSEDGLEALSNVSDKMEFTRYDATVTLSYIDRMDEGILTGDQLYEILNKEIVNSRAKIYYERFTEIIDKGIAEKYIKIDENGIISSTEDGKWLSIGLNKLNKYFFQTKGLLTQDKLKELCINEFGDDAEKQYQSLLKTIEKEVEKGHIENNQETGVYRINSTIKDIKNLLYQVYKENGSLKRDELRLVLENNIPNYDAERQYNYLTKRLDFLKSEGFLDGQDKEYSLNMKGIEKREDILVPQRNLLRKKLNYLLRLGLLEQTDQHYKLTDKYYKYMNRLAEAKENGIERTSEIISKDIYKLIDMTQDKVNVGKIKRTNERIARGKFINDEYKEIMTDYDSIRSYCNVGDLTEKTLKNLSTALLVSGVSLEETKDIINKWNIESKSNIDPEKITDIIEKSNSIVEENNLWGKTTIISSKDWNNLFESFGLKEKDIPKWIYKGENWKSFNPLYSIVNDIWKSAWREIERQRLQAEANAELMKKQQVKQQAINQSKEAIKEQIKKNKDRGSLYKEHDFEL